MNILGIDPGSNGGFAVLQTETNKIILTMRMPIIKMDGRNRSDVLALQESLSGLSIGKAILERAMPRPSEGATQGMVMGVNYGMLVAWLMLAKYPIKSVTPQEWVRRVHGKDNYEGKQTTIDWCRLSYPTADLIGSRAGNAKPSDGICDAIAMAYYGSIT